MSAGRDGGPCREGPTPGHAVRFDATGGSSVDSMATIRLAGDLVGCVPELASAKLGAAACRVRRASDVAKTKAPAEQPLRRHSALREFFLSAVHPEDAHLTKTERMAVRPETEAHYVSELQEFTTFAKVFDDEVRGHVSPESRHFQTRDFLAHQLREQGREGERLRGVFQSPSRMSEYWRFGGSG